MRRNYAGLDIEVENPAGSVRSWPGGQTVMLFDYGFIVGVTGTDGDEVDVYLGPNEQAELVYVVHQLAAPAFQEHDEDKCFLGFATEEHARAAYLAHRDDEKAYGGMSSMPLERFRAALKALPAEGGAVTNAAVALAASRFVGRAQRFDATSAPGPIPVRVWDRITSWGLKVKGARSDTFDDLTLGQMVANLERRGDLVPVDQDHASAATPLRDAPALAFYSALAIVRAGKVLKWASVPPERHAVRPDPSQPFADAATRPDGLYGYRCEITPRGESADNGLRNYHYLSPMFDIGANEEGKPVGYTLYAVAATNTPFQAGTSITFGATMQRAQTLAVVRGDALVADGWAREYDRVYVVRVLGEKVEPARLVGTDGDWIVVTHEDFGGEWEYRRNQVWKRPPPEQMSAVRGEEGTEMNPDLMKKLNLAAGASPSEVAAACSKFAMEASDEELRQMAAVLESTWWKVITDRDPTGGCCVQASSAEEAMRKAEAEGRGKALRAEPIEMGEMKALAQKMRRMSGAATAPEAGPQAMSQLKAELAAANATVRTLSSQVGTLAAAEQARTREAEAAKAKTLDDIVAEASRCGATEQEQRDIRTFAATSIEGAKRLVDRMAGSRAQLLARYTAGGSPLGALPQVTPQAGAPGLLSVDLPKNARLAAHAKQLLVEASTKPELAARIAHHAGPNPSDGMRLFAAQTIARLDRPDLVEDDE